MQSSLITIGARAWSQPVHRSGHLLAHAVLDVSLGLLGAVEAWAWRSLHLEGVNVRLDPCRVTWPILGELRILVLAWAWVPDIFTLETLVLGHGPIGSLCLILDRGLVVVGAGDVTQTLIIDEIGEPFLFAHAIGI